jgi:hypothetical protein
VNAAFQDYLMLHRHDPQGAVEGANEIGGLGMCESQRTESMDELPVKVRCPRIGVAADALHD